MSYAATPLSLIPLIQLKTSTKKRRATLSPRLDNSKANSTDPQLNLSVLRFTLGIPGLDESYLPRWIGYGFGSLLVLNHFAGSVSPTLPQLRTEALGVSLAAFSIALPYLGKFLKGATPMDQTRIPEGCEQMFLISETTSNTRKEDLAWATYILLRNTNTISVIISVQEELCVRGYWSIPEDVSKPNVLDWFEKQIKSIGLSTLKETLYLPQIEDSGLWEMLPKGTRSLVVQPVMDVLHPSDSENEKIQEFVLLASSMSWIRTLTKKLKFQSENDGTPLGNSGPYERWLELDSIVICIITNTFSTDALTLVIGCQTSKKVQILLRNLLKFKSSRDQLAAFGVSISDQDVKLMILAGLPCEYSQTRQIIRSKNNIDLEDVRYLLLSAEAEIDFQNKAFALSSLSSMAGLNGSVNHSSQNAQFGMPGFTQNQVLYNSSYTNECSISSSGMPIVADNRSMYNPSYMNGYHIAMVAHNPLSTLPMIDALGDVHSESTTSNLPLSSVPLSKCEVFPCCTMWTHDESPTSSTQ
ncbi:hypothetical protein ACLB2K_071985 [Fragaria x ananassa]